MYCGNLITGEAEAYFDREGRMKYRTITAEVDHGDGAYEPDSGDHDQVEAE
jgi:hypothetical protein